MTLVYQSTRDANNTVTASQAILQGLATDGGLFTPLTYPKVDLDFEKLKDASYQEVAKLVLSAFLDDFTAEELDYCINNAYDSKFDTPAIAPLVKLDGQYNLELFHGSTIAFKDMALSILPYFMTTAAKKHGLENKIVILTATSGDTGAAVAHAFYGLENINVVILYPKGKISPLQEKLFCTLGGNIRTVAINGDFDACQALVKQAFDDAELRQAIGLNSANSINISRLLAQVCYYFEAVAQLPKEKRDNVVVSVPSGNFGNLTAGLIAKTLGLPIKRFIASTNANDTVPRYLESGNWAPKATVATLSNAMDVSRPNNWPRVEELFKRNGWNLSDLGSGMLSDGETEETLKAMYAKGYLCEPHGAIAYQVLKDQLKADETGIFLCTAHPAKFKESVERILSLDLPLPEALDKHNKLPLLSDEMDDDFAQLRAYLLK